VDGDELLKTRCCTSTWIAVGRLGPELNGGFFTLIAVTDSRSCSAPRSTSPASPTTRCTTRILSGGWTASRIGTPEQNPKVYENASPLSHMDRLERPLLVLHARRTCNVPYLHSVRLIDELLKRERAISSRS